MRIVPAGHFADQDRPAQIQCGRRHTEQIAVDVTIARIVVEVHLEEIQTERGIVPAREVDGAGPADRRERVASGVDGSGDRAGERGEFVPPKRPRHAAQRIQVLDDPIGLVHDFPAEH